jgi:hypothetical protein
LFSNCVRFAWCSINGKVAAISANGLVTLFTDAVPLAMPPISSGGFDG